MYWYRPAGVCFGVMDGSMQMWYGSPGNLPIPSKSSLIWPLVLTILIFLAAYSYCIMGLHCAIIGPQLATMDPKWPSSVPGCCVMDPDVYVPLSWDNPLHLTL